MSRKPQPKLKTIKTAISAITPNELVNRETIQAGIKIAKEAKELDDSALQLIKIRMAFDKAHKEFKDALKERQLKIKTLKDSIDEIEESIKDKAREVVKVERKFTKTGTEKTTHDLNTTFFSYTPSKKSAVVDTAALKANPEKYKHLLTQKIVYEVDMEKVAQEDSANLPWVDNTTKAKISFKKELDALTLANLEAKEE